jgi:hypothetical protein
MFVVIPIRTFAVCGANVKKLRHAVLARYATLARTTRRRVTPRVRRAKRGRHPAEVRPHFWGWEIPFFPFSGCLPSLAISLYVFASHLSFGRDTYMAFRCSHSRGTALSSVHPSFSFFENCGGPVSEVPPICSPACIRLAPS